MNSLSEIESPGTVLVVDNDPDLLRAMERLIRSANETLAASGHELPVILITGRDDVETRRLLQRVNPIAVLLKPLDGNLLLAAIARALACDRQS